MATESAPPPPARPAPPRAAPARPGAAAPQADNQATLWVGAMLTGLLVLLFLGGMLVATVLYLMNAPPPPL